jgi:ubiquinone/menaquinone biosynthesis C-methylase UbiE
LFGEGTGETPTKIAAVAEPLAPEQMHVDARNAAFWNELCGSGLAKSLGIESIDRASLRRFDAAYMDLYPYLWEYLDLEHLRGERVLEIGLGFGTVSQLLAASAAVYHGVDIAPGPVEIVRDRLQFEGLPGAEHVIRASVLQLPYEDDSFDRVVTIGCLHHTGDLARSVAEVHRVLAPRGRAVVMIYNSNSLRRYGARARAFLTGRRGAKAAEWIRGLYDANLAGEAPPHIDYTSRSEAKRLFRQFAAVRVDVQNFADILLGPVVIRREVFLRNIAGFAGTDLYVVAVKA